MTHTFVNFGREASTDILTIEHRGKELIIFSLFLKKIINSLVTRFSKVAFIG